MCYREGLSGRIRSVVALMVAENKTFSALQIQEALNESVSLGFVATVTSRMFTEGDFGVGYICQPIFKDGVKVFKAYMLMPSGEQFNDITYDLLKLDKPC